MAVQNNTISLLLILAFLSVHVRGQKLSDPKISNRKPTTRTYTSNPVLDKSDMDWKGSRLEYMLGAGATGFLGDLGGQDGVGQPFIYDLEPTQTRYAISAGARYYLKEHHAIRGFLTYGRVRGSDELTNYPNRRYRNLNFKSPIIELAGIYEFHFIKPKYIHYMGARSTRVFDGSRFGAYASAGAGFFFFNPKGELDGQYHALKPLNTEGQGFPDGPKPYSRINVALPIGGGIYWLLERNFTVGLDFGYRWTTTDYIDDASGYFYDNQKIAERDGKLAAYFANPSVALENVPDQNWYTENQPRGGSKNNDTYMFVQLTLSKSLTPAISNREFKPKKKKKAKSFDKKRMKSLNKREKKAKTYKSKGIKNSKRKFKAPKLDFGRKKRKNKIRTF